MWMPYFMNNGKFHTDAARAMSKQDFPLAGTNTTAGTYNMFLQAGKPAFYVGHTYKRSTWLNTQTSSGATRDPDVFNTGTFG